MATAEDFAKTVKRPDKFFIDGGWASPSTDATINVITPSTEAVFMTVAEAQEADIDRAVAAARKAFDRGPWPRMSHAERAGYIRKIATGINARLADLSGIWTSEVGVMHTLAPMVSAAAAPVFDYYAGLADSYAFEERHRSMMASTALLVREPVGVVGAIVPWNGPLMLITYKLAPALLAGCTVVLKASPEAPGVPYVLSEIIEEAGLPPGVFNMVTADRVASERLVRHPHVDKIAFTGSSAVGKRIGAICAERVARVTLELGGKSAAVVLDDCDAQTVAAAMAQGSCMVTGQVCAALTRLIVPRSRHDEIAEAMAAVYAGIKVGDPFDPAIQMGPLAMARQRDRVEAYIAKGKAEGATLVTGGGRPSHLDHGFFIEPTVFGNVDNDMAIAREEIFGPVVSIISADSERQAIDIANDSPFGLNASVFTGDPDRAYKVARELRSGTVGHNGFKVDFDISFGGFKQSGIGREGGLEGLKPYLEAKTILLEGEPAHLAS